MFDFSPENLDREFPVRKNLIYLNHAAVCAMPARVAGAIADHARDVCRFGALHWKMWYRHYDETREKAAQFVGAGPEEVAFLPSTSHALNLIAGGIRWRTGDSIVGNDQEFPANVYPWMNLAEQGVEYRIAKSRDGRVTAQDILDQIDPTTRVVAVSWVAFHSGYVYPLAEIGKICEERNILFVVDAIQGLGTMPIDVKKWKIDVLAADSHKFLYGPEACALFAFSEKAKKEIGTPWIGWWNVPWKESQLDYVITLPKSGRRFEPGSLPTGQLYGLAAALELFEEMSILKVEARIAGIIDKLKAGLVGLGWTLKTPEGSRSAILSAVPPNINPKLVCQKLEEQNIIASVREGAVRFSPHAGNDEDQIDKVIEVLARLST
jgi:selenocysteine lyase/cysteine desulfurase